MKNVTEDVLMFLDTGFISSWWLATPFDGRKSMMHEKFEEEFIGELDLQIQIEETESTWNDAD